MNSNLYPFILINSTLSEMLVVSNLTINVSIRIALNCTF